MHRVTTTRTYITILYNRKSSSVPRDDLSSIAYIILLYFIIFSSREIIITYRGDYYRPSSLLHNYIILLSSSSSSSSSLRYYIIYIYLLQQQQQHQHYYIIFGNWRDICRGAHRCDSKPSPFLNCPPRRPRTCPVLYTVYRFDRDEYTSFNYLYPIVPFSILYSIIFYPLASSSPSKITPFFLYKTLHTRTICVYH